MVEGSGAAVGRAPVAAGDGEDSGGDAGTAAGVAARWEAGGAAGASGGGFFRSDLPFWAQSQPLRSGVGRQVYFLPGSNVSTLL